MRYVCMISANSWFVLFFNIVPRLTCRYRRYCYFDETVGGGVHICHLLQASLTDVVSCIETILVSCSQERAHSTPSAADPVMARIDCGAVGKYHHCCAEEGGRSEVQDASRLCKLQLHLQHRFPAPKILQWYLGM